MSKTWQGGEVIEWQGPSRDTSALYDSQTGWFVNFPFPVGTVATVLSSEMRKFQGRKEASILIILVGGEVWETRKSGWKRLL